MQDENGFHKPEKSPGHKCSILCFSMIQQCLPVKCLLKHFRIKNLFPSLSIEKVDQGQRDVFS